MGIEQILLPILGGIAKGTGEGLEIKRREQAAAAATRDAKLSAKVLDDFELAQSPDMQRFMQRYHGKEQWKALQSVMRIKHFEQQWQNREAEFGRFNPNPMPADFMPPMPPEPADGEGNQGSILGLISQFVPGAQKAMSALGIGGGGEAQAQMSPPSSTGPASGPQGYPQATPQASPVGGWQPAGVAGREALVNQIPRVDAPAAAPAGGGPVSGWQPVVPARVPVSPATLAAMDERMGPAAVGQVPTTTMTRTPRGGMTLTVEGGAAPTQTATQAAFTSTKYPRATTLPKGVSVTIGKNGRTYNFRNPEKDIPDKLWEAQKLYEMATGAPADMNNAAHALQVIKLSHALDTEELINKIGTEVRTRAEVESDPVVKEQLALVKYVTTQATQRAERDVAGEPASIDVRRREAEATATGGKIGEGIGQISPIPLQGGGTITPQQIDIDTAAGSAQAVEAAKVVDTVTQKKIDGLNGMLSLVDRVWQNYDPKHLGVIQGTSTALKWREIAGLAKGPESVMRQSMTTLGNLKIQDLTGAGVTRQDAERILAELPSPQDSPEVFVAKLTNFQTLLGEALDRVQRGATDPRSAQSPQVRRDVAPAGRQSANPRVQVPVVGTNAPVAKSGKFKGQPMKNTLPGVPTPAPLDNTATSAPPETVPLPAGLFKETPTPEEMATGNFAHKLTPEGQQALREAAQKGDLRKGSVYEYVP